VGKTATSVSDAAVEPVAVWDSGDAVYLAVLPKGPITVLQGTAAVIWRAAAAGPIDAAADRVAGTMGLQADDIRPSVDEFVGRLSSEGWIIRSR
jgi:hypothetical protein